MDAFAAIGRRVSARAFRDAPVARELIQRLLDAAVRAPNHKLTEPWRFAVLTGRSRDRYAERRRAHRATKFPEPGEPAAARAIEKTYREALATPAFIVVMCAVSDDPVRREEDYAASMMAIENLLIAASAAGLGTYVRTGGILEEPGVKALAELPEGYRIVAVVSVGYPEGDETPKRRTPASEKTIWRD